MKELPLTEEILVLIGLIFSASGFVWLTMLPDKPPLSAMVPRLGFIAAVFSCLWMLTLCWAACFAYVALKRGWTLRLAGIPFLAGGLSMVFFFLAKILSYGGVLLTCQAVFVPIIARRLAFVGLSTEHGTPSLSPVRPPDSLTK
jgi:hypothetical protein